MPVTPKTEYQLLFYFMQGREGRAQRRPHHSIFYPDLPARFYFVYARSTRGNFTPSKAADLFTSVTS